GGGRVPAARQTTAPPRRHGLPAPVSFPAPLSARQHHGSARAGSTEAATGGRTACARTARSGRAEAGRAALPGIAFGRRAAARGNRPRARHAPGSLTLRRADERARPAPQLRAGGGAPPLRLPGADGGDRIALDQV